MSTSNNLFHPFKSLGFVSNHIPLIIRYIKIRKEHLIVTCVGRAFQIYGASHLKLLNISPIHEDVITCIAGDNKFIYSSCKNNIYAWRSGNQLWNTFKGHDYPIELLLPFGRYLISIDINNFFKIWIINSQEIYSEMTFDKNNFKITALLHPNAYENKILLASQQGSMQLWNISTLKLVHTFEGWNCHITALEQSPTALDIVAVGLANGKIILHDLRYDQSYFELSQDWGSVTSLSFQTVDDILVSGSPKGHLVFWDLNKRKIHSQKLNAHKSSITGALFIENERLLVTSSPDNSVKMWVMDMVDGGARLLRNREGHNSPPTCIRFYSDDGGILLSAGHDSSLRIFSTLSETLNRSLGVASFNRKNSIKKKSSEEDNLKMPPIVSFAFEKTREKDWDNIAAVHQDLSIVTTWSYDKSKMGEHKLKMKKITNSLNNINRIHATCVSLTKCGNFVVVGYNHGQVERFNIQSGIHRLTYGKPFAHNGVVRGVEIDHLNRYVISGGNDNCIKFWHFNKREKQLASIFKLEESITFMRIQHVSSFLVATLDDFSIIVIDLNTQKKIREFIGHSSQITDVTFSPDSQWLVSASMDCTIRVWNIETGHLIDYFETESACTSISFSDTGEYLATAHVNHVGIFLWINSTMYSHVSLKPVTYVDDENVVRFNLCEFDQELKTTKEMHSIEEDEYTSVDQINDELVSLSLLPPSRWQNLLNLELIKKRNKPKEPVKKPKDTPFFLPTLSSLELKFDLSNSNDMETDEKSKSILNNLTVFGKLLNKSSNSENKNFVILVDKLKNYGPSNLDFEISSISPDNGGSISLVLEFMYLLEYMLKSNLNFELAQSYLSLFLKIHTNLIVDNKILLDFLVKIKTVQQEGWKRISEPLYYANVIDKLRL